MYYWQYKLHMKGGKNNAKLDLNPSLSAEKRAAKVARFFLLCVCARSEKACMLSYVGYLIGELLLGKTAC